MSWLEVFAVFVVAHAVGDFLLQTDWQARHKWGGLGADPVSRRALRNHLGTYALAFLPAFVWIASDVGLGAAIGAALLVIVPHWIQDDGRLLDVYIAIVKRPDQISSGLRVAVDQSFHLVFLFVAALIIGS
ncbi:MAG TPA: DUF3307 domain-containing protein [Solirubrobacterales bacterium]